MTKHSNGGFSSLPVIAGAFPFVFCFPCCPFFWANISLFISCSQEALSQMSTSVVEVWQPEDADPFVPLQVIITPLALFASTKADLWVCQSKTQICSHLHDHVCSRSFVFFPLPPSLCNPTRCASFTFHFIHTWKSHWLHSTLLLFKWLLISSLCPQSYKLERNQSRRPSAMWLLLIFFCT